MIKSPLKPKLYFKKQVEQLTNLNIQTLRRMWNRDEFPKPILVNNRCMWKANDIDEWLNNLGKFQF